MAKLFDKVRVSRPKLNKFDLSHERKMSLDMGKLVPMMVQEVIPGDKFRVNSELMMRVAPMIAPVMHRVNVYTHYFFVPNRLIWDEWEDFITGGRLGTSEPVVPYATFGNLADSTVASNGAMLGSLADYLGLPDSPGVPLNDNINISLLPFRAYQLIYDEYYRDQNLSPSIEISKASGAFSGVELTKLCTLRDRAWEKDYFTSALPWAQRGGEVSLPSEPEYKTVSDLYHGTGQNFNAGNTALNASSPGITGDATSAYMVASASVRVENLESIGITVNDLRRSLRLQEWLEKNARGGARYVEQILSHFGVISSDARIQRPEYLGGGKSPVVISEVLSSVESSDGSVPQANMAGHGVSFGTTNGFQRSFEEHGFIVGIVSVLPKTAYQQGVPRMFRRYDKFDHFWPEFANIGEQEVLQSELYYDIAGVAGSADAVFGYQSRYAEYKYGCSSVHGDFRDTLAFWHMGRIFAAPPALNATFVESDPTNRIFAVADGHHLYAQLFNRVDALRPMPYFGTPSI